MTRAVVRGSAGVVRVVVGGGTASCVVEGGGMRVVVKVGLVDGDIVFQGCKGGGFGEVGEIVDGGMSVGWNGGYAGLSIDRTEMRR